MESKGCERRLQMQKAQPLLFHGAMRFHAQAHLPGCEIKKAPGFQNTPDSGLLLQLPKISPAIYPAFTGS